MNSSEERLSSAPPVPEVLGAFINDTSLVVFSPGRINLIGEFTDYNKGFVLPAAIDKGVYVAITPRADQTIHLYSIDFKETYQTTVHELTPSASASWPNYLLGVVAEFRKAGVSVTGFDAVITGNMPIGSGMSSSAAVECATAMALNHLLLSRFDKMKLVQLAQRAENIFAGVQCGIMDQFASMFGSAGHAIKLDCRSLDYEYIPLSMDGLRIVLLNTNVKHSHGSSAYNERRAQCEAGVAILHQHEPGISCLRDATISMVDRYLSAGDAAIYKRCKFIVEENERVIGASEDLKQGDLASFGKKMFASHHGLQNLFEASCAELDFLVDAVRDNPAVLGARMMGGGFGGCTINLVKTEAVETLIHEVSARYSQAMNMELTPHIARIESGTTLIKQPAAHA